MMKFLKFALFSAAVLIGYSLWKFQATHERVVIEYGLVKATSETSSKTIVGRTRKVQQGPIEFYEVELPSNSWIACEGDCEDMLRRNTVDLHDDNWDAY